MGLGSDPKQAMLAFGDARHGWFAPRDFAGERIGWLFHTSDGGRTWAPQAVDNGQVVGGSLVATSASDGIVLTGLENAFFTRSGGRRGWDSTLTLFAHRRGARVRLSGALRPARRHASVWISSRGLTGSHWRRFCVTTRADGSFSATRTLEAGAYFVAQWAGNRRTDGAGSPAVRVEVTGP